jgi:lysophospholipase L1-like esterase
MNKKNQSCFLIKVLLLFVLLFMEVRLNAQTIDTSAYNKYVFINRTINAIENDSASLLSFYEKLYQLNQSKSGKLVVTHIGDSHIQADHMSGLIRQKMQLKFGNAGRGMVFPYRVAKSNEPVSYKTQSNKTWAYKRNVFPDKPLPIGVSGYTIETTDSTAEIVLTVKDQPGLGYKFNRFTLFHDKGFENFDITICDDQNCYFSLFTPKSTAVDSFTSSVIFDRPLRQIILQNKVSDSTCQKSTRIYGMLLENDSSGILYNMIGVNGAEYRHYTMSKYFYEQLAYLNSDLFILSLGTNEAYSAGFDKNVFVQQVDTLINSIKALNPSATFLITTPADSYRRAYKKGRVKNPDMKDAHEALIEYCLKNNLAYWNLYDIMGGYGSMQKWYVAKLTAKDKVHFSGRGYQIQGDLFYTALMKGYEEYVQSRK